MTTSLKHLAVAALAALALAVSGCGSKCDSTTCAGCCDASGVCQLGTTPDACGKAGDACAVCAGAQSCVMQVCAFPGGGIGGGNGGNTNSGGTTSSGSTSTSSSSGSSGTTTQLTTSSTSTTSSTGSTGETSTTSSTSSTGSTGETTTSSTTTNGGTSGTNTSGTTSSTNSGSTTSSTNTSGTSGTTSTSGSTSTTTTGGSGSTGGLGAICDPCTDASQCASGFCNTYSATTSFCDYATSCTECGSHSCDSVNGYCVCPGLTYVSGGSSGSTGTTGSSGSTGTTGGSTFCSAGPAKRTLNNSGIGATCTGGQADGGGSLQGSCATGQICMKLSPWDTVTRCTQTCDGSFTMCPGDAQCAYTDPTQAVTTCFPAGYDDGTDCPSGLVPAFPVTPSPDDITYCAPACRTSADCNGSNGWNYACVSGTCRCTNAATDCNSGASCDSSTGACYLACTDGTTCANQNTGCCLQSNGLDFCDAAATP